MNEKILVVDDEEELPEIERRRLDAFQLRLDPEPCLAAQQVPRGRRVAVDRQQRPQAVDVIALQIHQPVADLRAPQFAPEVATTGPSSASSSSWCNGL